MKANLSIKVEYENVMYFDIQARSRSRTPCVKTVVTRLRNMGYCACESTFGARLVRTNAVIDEKVLYELNKLLKIYNRKHFIFFKFI